MSVQDIVTDFAIDFALLMFTVSGLHSILKNPGSYVTFRDLVVLYGMRLLAPMV